MVGVEDPWAFWSDFHSMYRVPELSVNTRGSMEPESPDWQMKGWAWAVKGPSGADENGGPDALLVEGLQEAGEVQHVVSTRTGGRQGPR